MNLEKIRVVSLFSVLQMTDVEFDERVTALEERVNSLNGKLNMTRLPKHSLWPYII